MIAAPDPITAHEFSSSHRAELMADGVAAGCFHCCKTFDPAIIEEWIDEDDSGVGQTAICPLCGIDSIIGSSSGFPITLDFLTEMRLLWFGDHGAI